MTSINSNINGQNRISQPLSSGFTPASVTIILVALVIFSLLALNLVFQGPLISIDQQISQSLHASAEQAPAWVISLMNLGFFLGQTAIMIGAGLIGLYCLLRRDWPKFTLLALGVGGGSVWFIILANIFNRHRPSFPNPLRPVIDYPGFPSGHIISSVLFYGLIFYLLAPILKSRTQRLLVAALAILIVVFIGFSRVYIGDHYLTDVLAGTMIGIAWGTFMRSLVERYYRGRNT